ncbi:hypothetical protein SLA2020_197880 [Shorea laevis]
MVLSLIVESFDYSSILPCFYVGLMFPREGKTARTLLLKLGYFVHNFILPTYFRYTGFQFDVTGLASAHNVIIVVLMILLNFRGKTAGTLAVDHYLNIPQNDGFIFAFILSLKGHFELAVINTNLNS